MKALFGKNYCKAEGVRHEVELFAKLLVAQSSEAFKKHLQSLQTFLRHRKVVTSNAKMAMP